jgi:VanZ family protein
VRQALVLWLPAVVWAGLIFWASSVPNLSTGLGSWDLVLRKGAHLTAYAVLAVLLWRPLRHELAALAVAVAYAASDEFHQSFVRGRHGSSIDVLIDGIGALAGLALFAHARRRPRAVP